MSTRIYRDRADKQKAYRARKDASRSTLIELTDALITALDNGRASKLAKGLPEEPDARARELACRIRDIALVKFPKRA